MKPNLIRQTFFFWLLLAAMAFSQERRDPTQPSPAIRQRLVAGEDLQPDAPPPNIKLKAIVLRDRDHGTALLETPAGVVRITLHRDVVTEINIDQTRFVVKDFSASSLQLEPSK